MSEPAYVFQPGEGRRLDMGAFLMTVKAGTDQTGGAFSLLEAEEPPGFGPPMHIHHDAAEAFYVLDGEYIISLPGQQIVCPGGAFIYIPAGLEHGFKVGDRPSRKLNIYVPAAMTGFFEEMAAAEEPLSDDAVTALAATYSMEVTGPVPEGYV